MGRHVLTRPRRRGASAAWPRLVPAGAAEAVLLTAAALLLWAVALPAALGYRAVSVRSGSMAPSIRVGDVVVADPHRSPSPGQIAVFEMPGQPGRIVTHRLVSQDEDGWITKGDANDAPDPWRVDDHHLIGVARVVVPYVGLPSAWSSHGETARIAALTLATGVLASLAAVLHARGGRHLLATSSVRWRRRLRRTIAASLVPLAVASMLTIRPAVGFFVGGTDGASTYGALTLAAPTGVSAVASCQILVVGPKVTISWTAVTGATSYLVQRATNAAGPWSDLTTVASGTVDDLTVAGLTTYHYRITAKRGTWTSSVSATASASTGLCL